MYNKLTTIQLCCVIENSKQLSNKQKQKMKKWRMKATRLGEPRKLHLRFISNFIFICEMNRRWFSNSNASIQRTNLSARMREANSAVFSTRDSFSDTVDRNKTSSIATIQARWLVVIRIYIGISVAA